VRRILKNMDRAKAGEIKDDEFRTAQQMIVAFHALENDTIEAQARLAALHELYGLGYDYDRQFDARIQAVTRDDVVRIARKYLTQYLLVTSSPKGKE
jgi:zinc protease